MITTVAAGRAMRCIRKAKQHVTQNYVCTVDGSAIPLANFWSFLYGSPSVTLVTGFAAVQAQRVNATLFYQRDLRLKCCAVRQRPLLF